MECPSKVTCYHIYVADELWSAATDINIHQEMLDMAHEIGLNPTEERIKNRGN